MLQFRSAQAHSSLGEYRQAMALLDQVFATMLAQTKYEGLVAACGLAGGVGLPTTVMPFILRGVTLRGIDSVQAAMPRRLRAWADLAELIDASALAAATQVKPLAEVPALAKAILAGQVQGRVVIDVNA
jgi:acrylyl-CoA reductase (NADPH)